MDISPSVIYLPSGGRGRGLPFRDKGLPLRGVGSDVLPRPWLRLSPAPLPSRDARDTRPVARPASRGLHGETEDTHP